MRMGSWTPASARWVNREWRSWCRVRGSQRRCGPTGVLNSAHRHGEPDDKGEKRHRGRRQQRARRRPPAAHRRHRQRYHADRGHHRGVEVYERGRPEPGKGEDHAPPPDTPAAEAPCRRPQDRRRPRGRRHAAPAAAGGPEVDDTGPRLPVYPVVVLVLTLAGFGAASFVHLDPAVVAAIGVVALAVPAVRGRRPTPGSLLSAAAVPFLAFVVGLAVVVRAVQDAGLSRLVPKLVPDATTLPALLLVTVVAAVLANLVNNLPAVLMLLPTVAAVGSPAVLAALIGVNIGPNLTYVGSLATLLWKRLLRARDVEATQVEFLRLGALTVPAALVAATLSLWVAVRVIGA